jgi:hypothetical protein
MQLRTILAERLGRQHLSKPIASVAEYETLFRALQPVAPIGYSYPGSPPRLVHRTRFDDAAEANRLRAERALVKGRFLGGRVGYVHADDLQVYATAFQRPLTVLTEEQETVLNAVRTLGPITPRQLKDETGLLNKHLMPVLHRLQEAFLVYEDQPDENWERGWYAFDREWPMVDLNVQSWEDATRIALRRFFRAQVFATLEQLRDWSGLPAKPLAGLVAAMESDGELLPVEVETYGAGWIGADDAGLKSAPTRLRTGGQVALATFMLDTGDILVRSHISVLKRKFAGQEVLQYLLIDGDFQGAVLGHWRIGPHDVEDIVLDLSDAECDRRQDEILHAVATTYHPPRAHIRRYAGREMQGW